MNFVGTGRKVTKDGVLAAGKTLKVDAPSILAVMSVESNGKGWDGKGRLKMLFEPHVFYRNLKGTQRTAAVKAGLAYEEWKRGYPKDSYPRLEKAVAINEDAALKAASWGLFQILGENFRAAGYATPRGMVEDYLKGEDEQLQSFARFVVAKGLADDLREGRESFFEGYNGPSYKANGYDKKFLAARAKYRAEADKDPSVEQPELSRDEIADIQRLLDTKGYHEVGEIDGLWGRRTRGALSTFQLDNGLPGTGMPDTKTLEALAIAPPRKVDTARVKADAKAVAAAAPGVIQPTLNTQRKGLFATIGSGAAAAGAGAISYLREGYEYVAELRESIPIWAWLSLLAAVCFYFGYYRPKRQEEASVNSYRAGKVV